MQHVILLCGENKTTKYTAHSNPFAKAEHQLLLKKVFIFLASVFLHEYKLVVRDYACRAKMSRQKELKKLFLIFSPCPNQSKSHVVKLYLAMVED